AIPVRTGRAAPGGLVVVPSHTPPGLYAMTINSAGSNGGASSPDAYPDTYYAATARKAPLRPALEGVKQVDVCVIGGGYTGLSTALHCAERGLSVVVLEGRRNGWGASGMNGRQGVPGWNRATRGLIPQV